MVIDSYLLFSLLKFVPRKKRYNMSPVRTSRGCCGCRAAASEGGGLCKGSGDGVSEGSSKGGAEGGSEGGGEGGSGEGGREGGSEGSSKVSGADKCSGEKTCESGSVGDGDGCRGALERGVRQEDSAATGFGTGPSTAPCGRGGAAQKDSPRTSRKNAACTDLQ